MRPTQTLTLTATQAAALKQHVALKAKAAPSAERRAQNTELANRIPLKGGTITVTYEEIATHLPTRRLYTQSQS